MQLGRLPRATSAALTLLISFIATLEVKAKDALCSSLKECCLLCGDGSERCARGPCSMNVVTRVIFSTSIPTDDIGFWDVVFSFYGLVPYLVPMVIMLDFIFHRRSWMRVFAFFFIPIFGFINSIILVKSLGECSECSRPCGSCVSSNGMPSGHAANAIGLCLWLILETFLGAWKQCRITTKVAACVGLIVLFVPVPYSRMYLGDHTDLQVVIGSAAGIVFGLIYFFVFRYIVGRHLPHATEQMMQGRFHCLKMQNDFYIVNEDNSIALLGSEEQSCSRSDSMDDTSTKL